MRIIRRINGDSHYFYLQHSVRKGKKVITREKYIGTSLPVNIQDIKRDFLHSLQFMLYEKLEAIKKNFKNEWQKLPESAKQRELQEIAISFTYNSNAIEGSTITLHEVRDIIQHQIAPNKPLRDVHEAGAHAQVFFTMLTNEKIDEKLLLRWHAQIFGETKLDIAGRYRDYIVRVGDYIAPDWQDVHLMMKKLMRFVKNSKDMNPVERAARIHFQFEKIHPFGDGNGRIGRLLMNQILWHGYCPMLIIEYKKRKSYYRAFKKDEDGFVQYFLKRYLSVHASRLK
ncbi:MAG TPA: Fic family protein [Candidatus Nanoarchaeia archaeon]|nr:Fic family protein [Candidatus Nanoarchaeia archaeon]